MTTARLTARWNGHQIGTLVVGDDAERAIMAGVAQPENLGPAAPAPADPEPETGAEPAAAGRKKKKQPSPTQSEDTTEETSDDDAGDPDDG
jgi:hypothetical protein